MLTTKEISDYLHVSEETVRRWIRKGDLKAIQEGKSYLVDEVTLNEFIKEQSKVAGTSISKMATKMLPIIGGAASIFNPIIGGGLIAHSALLSKLGKKQEDSTSSTSASSSETSTTSTNTIKDIEDYIETLYRHKKKIELEHQIKLLEIDDEIANYKKLKEQIEKGRN